MKIAFVDFWGGFNDDNNTILHFCRQAKEDIQVVAPFAADVLFFGPFGNNNQRYNTKKIFYTGENIRPNTRDCTYSLSFDYDSYNGKNFRFPLWLFYVDWFGVKSYTNPEWLIPENYLYEPNEFTLKPKDKFCSIVFSSYYENRANTIRTLSTYKPVNVYGKSGGMAIPEGEKVKLDIISDYKFSICYENSIYEGYVTEKLLHAKIAGTVPLYYCHETFERDFNKECCINTLGMTQEEILETVKEIDSNTVFYENILKQPLFKEKFNINEYVTVINNLLK